MTDPPPHIPFQLAASYPARAGNLVQPLIDGEPAFRRICDAVEAAHHSVWVTVAFIRSEFRMPGGRGGFFDVLDRAVDRGLDVRVIFWRPNPEASYVSAGSTFSGAAADRDTLAARGSRWRIRWDRAHGPFCQHQKCWVIDAGRPSETTFVGGINLNPRAMVSPGHAAGGGMHDAYVEVSGPSATDVHHNFVQRWNEASERGAEDGVWGHTGTDDLAFPDRLSDAKGTAIVQIQRNVHAGRYRNSRPNPGAEPFEIAEGETTIREQYFAAIKAARRSIYIENQALSVGAIVDGLRNALQRGVQVVVLLPAEPERWVTAARRRPENREFFDKLAALGQHENFCLAGIAGNDAEGLRKSIYVHAKLMLIDDAWATIGSCNLHRNSLFGHTELNASIWSSEHVRSLRRTLLAEHLGHDTGHMDDREALILYRRVAMENAGKRASGRNDWDGIAFSLDPAAYGM
jgi:phosphatidylserine/phosphatidylglycerophosphate/cardiolipin synthase-like enzyme